MTEPVAPKDIDPGDWADPAPSYDAVAVAYANKFLHELERKQFDRDLLTRYAAAIGLRSSPGAPICDLGCGPGHIGAFVAEHGADVIGIDLSAGMVEEARRRYPALTFSQGSMTALEATEGSWSGIVCFYALIHIPRAQVPDVLLEMRRVLVDGGALLLAVHGGAGSLHGDLMADQPANLDFTLFTLPELYELVRAAGFAVAEAHERPPYPDERTQRLYLWGTK